MAALTIRNVDDSLRDRLRVRAARHGRSMEAEVRAILQAALAEDGAPAALGTRIHQRFLRVGGVEIDMPERSEAARSPDLS